jgi:hypothetical protein
MVAALGVPVAELTPGMGLDLMARLFAEDPADAHLSCAWGVVTRHGPEDFGFSFSRWEVADAQFGILLSLDIKCGPRAEVVDLPGWMRWCVTPQDLARFRAEVEATPAFRTWGHGPCRGAVVHGDDSLEASDSPFDCWGARDPDRPELVMSEAQWLSSDDVPLMVNWLRQEWQGESADLNHLVQRYLLTCCRQLWRLLPMDESRRGVEVAERHAAGRATHEELYRAEWEAEGAAFFLDPCEWESGRETSEEREDLARYNAERKARIGPMLEGLESLPPGELGRLLGTGALERNWSPRQVLSDAANLVDTAMCYPGIRPKHRALEKYGYLLPASLLREFIGNPFRPEA